MSKRFVSWAAVSSLPQAEKISLTEQRAINLRVVEQHGGILVADLIVDESRDIDELSEACERIPEYATLRHLIKNNGVDVVVLYTRSRLGRVMAMVETIAQLCRRHGVVLYETDTPPQSIESETYSDTDLLTGAVRSWKAQQEVEELKRRRTMGMQGRFERGNFLGHLPWGWKRQLDDKGKPQIVIDEQAASVIRFIFIDLYLGQGFGCRQIVRELNRRGTLTKTGKTWNERSLETLLRMTWRYAGWGEINKYSKENPYARTKGNWPAIITEDELQLLLAERDSRKGARGRLAKVHRLSLMVHCAVCNQRMHMFTSPQIYQKANGETSSYTYIFAVCKGPYHPNRNVPIKRIIKIVRAFFVTLQDRGNWAPHLQANDVDASLIDTEMAAIEKEIRKAEQAILEADDKLIDGTFDAMRHGHQIQRLKGRIANLQGDATALTDRKAAIEYAARRVSRLEEIAEHGLEYLDMEDEGAANAKLRRLIQVDVAGGKVVNIRVL